MNEHFEPSSVCFIHYDFFHFLSLQGPEGKPGPPGPSQVSPLTSWPPPHRPIDPILWPPDLHLIVLLTPSPDLLTSTSSSYWPHPLTSWPPPHAPIDPMLWPLDLHLMHLLSPSLNPWTVHPNVSVSCISQGGTGHQLEAVAGVAGAQVGTVKKDIMSLKGPDA